MFIYQPLNPCGEPTEEARYLCLSNRLFIFNARLLTFLNDLRITMTRFWSYLSIFIFSFALIACRGLIITVMPNDWEIFHESKDGVDSYYNVNLIRYTSKDTVEVWTKIFVSDDEKNMMTEHMTKDGYPLNGWDRWRYSLCLIEINCNERSSRRIQVTYYDDKGKVLDSGLSKRVGNWELIVPDSLGGNLLKKVCNTSIR